MRVYLASVYLASTASRHEAQGVKTRSSKQQDKKLRTTRPGKLVDARLAACASMRTTNMRTLRGVRREREGSLRREREGSRTLEGLREFEDPDTLLEGQGGWGEPVATRLIPWHLLRARKH